MQIAPAAIRSLGYRPLLAGALGLFLCGLALPITTAAQSVAWARFGPDRPLLQLQGLTDALPDFVGPIDGSADLTIFTEGNHFPVLLPLVFETFPAWCARTMACRADPGRILVVTLPQTMIVDMLLKGGVRLGNAVIPVGRERGVFPDLVMAGEEPLKRLCAAGIVDGRATLFARHRGLGLLLRRDLANVRDLEGFVRDSARVVLASEGEAGARRQYLATLQAVTGNAGREEILAHEVKDFPGRLGIQHRDVPYAVLNGIAQGGVIFDHLAAFYAESFPDSLRHVAVPAASRFGQQIALAKTADRHGFLTEPFERFFVQQARIAYPARGFSPVDSFAYGAELTLAGK